MELEGKALKSKKDMLVDALITPAIFAKKFKTVRVIWITFIGLLVFFIPGDKFVVFLWATIATYFIFALDIWLLMQIAYKGEARKD